MYVVTSSLNRRVKCNGHVLISRFNSVATKELGAHLLEFKTVSRARGFYRVVMIVIYVYRGHLHLGVDLQA